MLDISRGEPCALFAHNASYFSKRRQLTTITRALSRTSNLRSGWFDTPAPPGMMMLWPMVPPPLTRRIVQADFLADSPDQGRKPRDLGFKARETLSQILDRV